MKTYSTFTFLICILGLLASCQSKQTTDQCLADDSQRAEILTAVAHHPAYMSEMMQQMMTNDSGRHAMAESMMKNPDMKPMMMDQMMSMCASDSAMCKMMMGKTMDMCDADPASCKMMMGSMESRPNVKKAMKGMCDMENMNMDPKKDNPVHKH